MSSQNHSEMESEPLSDVQKLIRLKRYENPPEDAVDDFLVEFQRRQRSQALTGSSTKLFFERVVTFMSGFGRQKWVFAAGGVYACIMLFFLVRPSVTPMGPQPGSGSANPVQGTGKTIIQKPAPTYVPKANEDRPLPRKVPEVIVL